MRYKKPLYIKKTFNYPLIESEVDSIYLKFELDKNRYYDDGDQVGVVKVMISDKKIYEDAIYISKKKAKERKSFLSWFKKIW